MERISNRRRPRMYGPFVSHFYAQGILVELSLPNTRLLSCADNSLPHLVTAGNPLPPYPSHLQARPSPPRVLCISISISISIYTFTYESRISPDTRLTASGVSRSPVRTPARGGWVASNIRTDMRISVAGMELSVCLSGPAKPG